MKDFPAVVLGLDMATHTGYSIWKNGRLVKTGEIDCAIKTKSTGNPDPEGKRFHLLRNYLHSLLITRDITHVFHERTVGGITAGGAPALISGGMTAICQQLCFEYGVACESISTGTLKKHATGNGGHVTKKPHMIQAAGDCFGFHFMPTRTPTKSKPWNYDDDVADAIWAGHYGVCKLQGVKFTGTFPNV